MLYLTAHQAKKYYKQYNTAGPNVKCECQSKRKILVKYTNPVNTEYDGVRTYIFVYLPHGLLQVFS